MAEILKVDEILSELEIADNMKAAEFGCGMGMFAMVLAKKLKNGKVYALDVQEEKISALISKLKQEQISNVVTIVCDLEEPEGSTLQDNYVDIVVIPNVLFQSENKYAIIQEAKRVLRPQGQLLIIDWSKQAPFGPKEYIASANSVKAIIEGLGLILKKEFSAGDYHYGLLYEKP